MRNSFDLADATWLKICEPVQRLQKTVDPSVSVREHCFTICNHSLETSGGAYTMRLFVEFGTSELAGERAGEKVGEWTGGRARY